MTVNIKTIYVSLNGMVFVENCRIYRSSISPSLYSCCLGVLVITFTISHSFGNPVVAWLGRSALLYPNLVNLYIKIYHLNDPLYLQFFYYIKGLLAGELRILALSRLSTGFTSSRPDTSLHASALFLCYRTYLELRDRTWHSGFNLLQETNRPRHQRLLSYGLFIALILHRSDFDYPICVHLPSSSKWWVSKY